MSQSYKEEAMEVRPGVWQIICGGYLLTGFDGEANYPTREACEAEIAEREKRGLILREMFTSQKVMP